MIRYVITELRISLLATVSLAVILCGIYPLIIWVLSQGFFPQNANGSLILQKGTVVGSRLLAQGFSHPKYFHPRPSVAGQGYDATTSGGSNLGPTSKRLIDAVKERVVALSDGESSLPRGSRAGGRRNGICKRPRPSHQPEERPVTGSPGGRCTGLE